MEQGDVMGRLSKASKPSPSSTEILDRSGALLMMSVAQQIRAAEHVCKT